MPTKIMTRLLAGTAISALLTGAAFAADANARPYDIPQQDAATALQAYAMQSGKQVLFPYEAAKGKQAPQIKGDYSDGEVIALLARSAGLQVTADDGKTVTLRPQASAAGEGGDEAGTVQALIVTAQKREENIQDVPIAMSAFTQEDLTRSQVAGGPDLMTQVPNMTFTKTNFSSYSIQIRGIGTQAISATTDAAVAVAFNNTPFIRNRFFEQEFYDLQRVEVLRGPQGTLYGRNATAGVVNLLSAKPKFAYEARLSADVSNYKSSRLEGMINVPLVEDKVALRLAGAWTKRDGYDTNQITGNQIDGRDLWSTRLSLRFAPTDKLDANLIWEHFQEKDDRLRSGKQLCNTDNRTEIQGYTVPPLNGYSALFSQGCLPASLYSPDSFEVPNGYSLPYYLPLGEIGLPTNAGMDPYASATQSHDLRVIESTVDPIYKANTDVVELQLSYDLGQGLTLTSETGYLRDTIFSMEDYNRFNTQPGAFNQQSWDFKQGNYQWRAGLLNDGVFCDPQVGCSDRLVAVDVSTAKSTQFSQEFRISSDYTGPFNFSLGANFLRYDTEDKYYVFINTLGMIAAISQNDRIKQLGPYTPGVTDNTECLKAGIVPPGMDSVQQIGSCTYIDPNPIGSLNDLGHNYFLSKNPYKLISYAIFGEAYYNITDALKLTAGLRWTVDKKEAPRIPSWLLADQTAGYPVFEVIDQEWREPTGRLALDWKPKLPFTDQTLLYASLAHGYKAGGMNPPPTGTVVWAAESNKDIVAGAVRESLLKPKTFEPEFVNAFELGTKNTLLDGRLTLNGDAFYYDYTGYQISQIIDRSAVNYNFDAKVWGLELEADWRPLENLRLGFKGGYEKTRIANGERAIDIMDRTAGTPGWVVVRPFPTFPSNCVLPIETVSADGALAHGPNVFVMGNPGPCEFAYLLDLDPVTGLAYVPDPTVQSPSYGSLDLHPGYHGFNPDFNYGNNHGEGFYKELGGHELPNAPHFTATITADYTIPLPNSWLATLHTDLYYQSEAWTRVFNTPGYDKLKAYTNVNLAAIFSNEDAGWKIMAYVKNVMDRDSITGAFLNSDDTGLTTNVFLTEPRLYGLRVTKEWTGGPWWMGANPNHTGPYPLTVELGGQVQRQDAPSGVVQPSFAPMFGSLNTTASAENRRLDWGDGREVKLTYRPDGSTWNVSAAARYGKTNSRTTRVDRSIPTDKVCGFPTTGYFGFLGRQTCDPTYVLGNYPAGYFYVGRFVASPSDWANVASRSHEEHTIVDFAVGHDVGLGMLRDSSVAAGLRYASFRSDTAMEMHGVPDWYVPDQWALKYGTPGYNATAHRYHAKLFGNRRFNGAGPTLSWEAGAPLLGNEDTGHVKLDWSVTGGVLFGKQKTTVTGYEQETYFSGKYTFGIDFSTPPKTPVHIQRSKSATVPVVDLSLGLSYEIQRVKVGAGYRWERYYNVLDGGDTEHESYDRTIDGPYFKIAVGFGG